DVLVEIEFAILHQAQGADHRDVLTDRAGLENSIRGNRCGLAGFEHTIAARPLDRAAVNHCYAEARGGVVGHAFQDRDALSILAPERRIRRDAILDPVNAGGNLESDVLVGHDSPCYQHLYAITRSPPPAARTVPCAPRSGRAPGGRSRPRRSRARIGRSLGAW